MAEANVRIPDDHARNLVDPVAYADGRVFRTYDWLRSNQPLGRAEVEGVELVPVFDGSFAEFDTRVPGCVIDQGVDGFSISTNRPNPFHDLPFTEQINLGEVRIRAGRLGEALAGALFGVAEVDLGSLSMEGADDGGADAVGTAGDEDDLVAKFWKDHARTMPQGRVRRK